MSESSRTSSSQHPSAKLLLSDWRNSKTQNSRNKGQRGLERTNESHSRPAPMNVDGQMILSYGTLTNSIRSRIDRPTILPERGRQLNQSSSSHAHSRSKSIDQQNRRGGSTFITPTKPDLNLSGFPEHTSRYSRSNDRDNEKINNHRRREISMPPPARQRVNENIPVIPTRNDRTLRRRGFVDFDSYLYPDMRNNLRFSDKVPRNYRNLEEPKITTISVTKVLNTPTWLKRDQENISMFNDGYYTHEIKTNRPRHYGHPSPSNHNNNNNNYTIMPTSSKQEQLNVHIVPEKLADPCLSSKSNKEEAKVMTLTRKSDSGFGSSILSFSCGPLTQRIRYSLLPYSNVDSYNIIAWNSKQHNTFSPKYHNPIFTENEMARSIEEVSLIEMINLRKKAISRLREILGRKNDTAHFADYELDYLQFPHTKQAWIVHRLIRKIKLPDAIKKTYNKDTNEYGLIFNTPLEAIYHRTGYFLPRPIMEVINFLKSLSSETVGIFRKNGVKSRISELRKIIDKNIERGIQNDVFIGEHCLDPTQVHDAADLLKQYFRDLPEPLMTVKMSEVFANICSLVPDVDRLTALQYAIVLLPDENRMALKTLLLLLKDVSRNSQINNMTAQNLSVCFTPSLFQLSASRLDKITPGRSRHKSVDATGLPSEKEMKEAIACQLCLTMLIEYAHTVFMVPDCIDNHFETEQDHPNPADLGLRGPRSFLVDRVMEMIRDHSDAWKTWTPEGSWLGVEIFSRHPGDSHPLKTFRVCIKVPASPKDVMMRILNERYTWDTSVLNWRHVEYINAPDTDIHQYVLNETIGHPTKDCHVARFHSSGLSELRGACAIAERSVKCAENQLLGGISATIFDQRFLIEPISEGLSLVNYIARVDFKGRSLQWYNKSFGTVMCRHLHNLRDSFQDGLGKISPKTNS